MQQGSEHTEKEILLAELLAGMRVTATPEADFEARFLYDFHEAVAREAVCCPAHRRVWEHLMQLAANFGMPRMAFGASSLGVAALALGLFSFSDEESRPASVGGLALHRFESSLTSLTPGMARDFDSCTSIRIVKKSGPFAHEGELVARSAASGPAVNSFTSSSVRERSAWDAAEENVAADALWAY